MATGGLSEARLGRMHEVMAGHVARGAVPGIVTLVSRLGEVHVDAIGMKALGGRRGRFATQTAPDYLRSGGFGPSTGGSDLM